MSERAPSMPAAALPQDTSGFRDLFRRLSRAPRMEADVPIAPDALPGLLDALNTQRLAIWSDPAAREVILQDRERRLVALCAWLPRFRGR